jgi:hypothetical protein
MHLTRRGHAERPELAIRELRTNRNLLVEEFARNPSNTNLAVIIRLIDDRIVELTGGLSTRKKKTE